MPGIYKEPPVHLFGLFLSWDPSCSPSPYTGRRLLGLLVVPHKGSRCVCGTCCGLMLWLSGTGSTPNQVGTQGGQRIELFADPPPTATRLSDQGSGLRVKATWGMSLTPILGGKTPPGTGAKIRGRDLCRCLPRPRHRVAFCLTPASCMKPDSAETRIWDGQGGMS